MSNVIVAVLPDIDAVIAAPTKFNSVAFPLIFPSSLIEIALNVPAPAEVTAPHPHVPSPFAMGT
jgi:hypothetical protein